MGKYLGGVDVSTRLHDDYIALDGNSSLESCEPLKAQ